MDDTEEMNKIFEATRQEAFDLTQKFISNMLEICLKHGHEDDDVIMTRIYLARMTAACSFMLSYVLTHISEEDRLEKMKQFATTVRDLLNQLDEEENG